MLKDRETRRHQPIDLLISGTVKPQLPPPDTHANAAGDGHSHLNIYEYDSQNIVSYHMLKYEVSKLVHNEKLLITDIRQGEECGIYFTMFMFYS